MFGNQVQTTLGYGATEATTTSLTYDVLGQRTKATDPRNLNTTYTLDTRGLLDRTHLRFYTKRTAARMIEDGGFKVTRLQAAVPVPLLTWAPLSWLAYRAGNLWPNLCAYTYVITAVPADHRLPIGHT